MDIRCQQFTKEYIANEMLDLLGYRKSVYGKKNTRKTHVAKEIYCVLL